MSNRPNYYSEKKIRNNDSINDIKNSSFINKKKYYLTSISEDISGSGVSQIGYNLSLSNYKRKINDRVNNKLSNR